MKIITLTCLFVSAGLGWSHSERDLGSHLSGMVFGVGIALMLDLGAPKRRR